MPTISKLRWEAMLKTPVSPHPIRMIVPNRFKDTVVLITGAGSGIGRGIASRFAAEGASVVLVDIREEAANAVLSEIQSRGGIGMVSKRTPRCRATLTAGGGSD